MKVLFTLSGWPTHFFMMTPLAWALRVAGHEVRIATPPGCVGAVVGAGLPAVVVGDDIDFVALQQQTLEHEVPGHDRPDNPEELDEFMHRDGAAEVLGTWLDATFARTGELVRFSRAWRPDLVVTDSGMCEGGIVAAHVIGVPAVRHLVTTDIMGSVHGDELLEQMPDYRRRFEAYGLTPHSDPAQLTIDPCPPSMQPPPSPSRRQMRHVPYNGPGALPAWALEAPVRPRVTVSWGTMTARTTGPSRFAVPRVLDALSGLDVEVVLTIARGQRDLLGALPANVRLLEHFPLHQLMPTTSVMVHQGGASSVLTAAAHGVPQLHIPFLSQQIDDSAAHVSTGAGRSLHVDEADAESIRREVVALLDDPAHRAAAARLRREIDDQPSPVEIAGLLTQLAS